MRRVGVWEPPRAAGAARAVVIAWRTIVAASFPEPAFPARSRTSAITGVAVGVLIVATSGDRPLLFPGDLGVTIADALFRVTEYRP